MYTCCVLSEASNLLQEVQRVEGVTWPEYIYHSLGQAHWDALFEMFLDYQLALRNDAGQIVATAYSIPLFWDGTRESLPAGWDASLQQGVAAYHEGIIPNTLCALSIDVTPEHRRQGLSQQMLLELKLLGSRHHFKHMIGPVRPTWKHRYPLIPMDTYVQWKYLDTAWPFDPWLRVHVRNGAHILALAPSSMTVTGTRQQWEAWTGMSMPTSGSYIIPQALQPLIINEQAQGIYEEPNVWVCHALASCCSSFFHVALPGENERGS